MPLKALRFLLHHQAIANPEVAAEANAHDERLAKLEDQVEKETPHPAPSAPPPAASSLDDAGEKTEEEPKKT